MNLDSFTGPGSTPSRRRFWDRVTVAVIASQKVAGRNVSVDVHDGQGTMVSVPDTRVKPSGGACGPVPCHCIGEIDFTVAGDHYGSGAFFVDDDFTVIDPTHLTISLTTTVVIRRTSDDAHCFHDIFSECPVSLTINVVCDTDTHVWTLSVIIEIAQSAVECVGDPWPTDDGIFWNGSAALGTLPDTVSPDLSGTYTGGTLSGTSSLTVSAVCGVFGACNFPCPDTTTPCSQRTEAGCMAIGGEWQGAGTEDCPPKTGACYTEGDTVCTIMTAAECAEAGGDYDADCTECPP